MGTDKKTKRISYRRTVFLSPGGKHTLEKMFELSRKKIGSGCKFPAEKDHPAIEERHHIYKAGVGHFIHVAAFTPGEEASIVPHGNGGDLATTPPPEDTDFMDGDIMALISGNDVVLCSNSLHEKQLERFILQYLESAGFNKPSHMIELTKVANVDRIKMLKSEGVKEIQLDSSLYEATFMHEEKETISKKLAGNLAAELKALIFKDGEEIDPDDAENLSVKVVLSFDKRKKGADFCRKKLQILANRAFSEEDEGVKIVTYNGDKVSASDINLKKTVTIPRHGKSVWYYDAWDEIELYYNELNAGGFLEM